MTGLAGNGVRDVRAFGLPEGIWRDGTCAGAARAILVRWRSNWTEMFHQVYVNRRFAGVTVDTEQREMLAPLPVSPQSPIRIEVFAVEPENANRDFSQQLAPTPTCSGRVKIEFLRSQTLPVGGTAQIHSDGGTGCIDYETPLTRLPMCVWPSWQDKAGFGMSRFGASDFGYDSPAAVGFGKGSSGRDHFGVDADTIEWTSPALNSGVYRFAARITDVVGNTSNATETEPITVTPAARPAEKASISSIDTQTRQIILSVS